MSDEYGKLRGIIDAAYSALGGTYYMDPPDGGCPTLAEQIGNMRAEIERLRAQVAKLREALAFYADREMWRGDPCPAHSDVDGDFVATVGKKARDALKETE